MPGQLGTAALEALRLRAALRRLLLEPGPLLQRPGNAQIGVLERVACVLRRARRLEPRALAAALLHARKLVVGCAQRVCGVRLRLARVAVLAVERGQCCR